MFGHSKHSSFAYTLNVRLSKVKNVEIYKTSIMFLNFLTFVFLTDGSSNVNLSEVKMSEHDKHLPCV